MSLTRRFRLLRGALFLNLALLLLVFLLGMAVNLYVSFPDNLPGGNATQWAMSHSPMIQFHIVTATLIVLIGIVAVVLSALERHSWGIIATVAGVILTAMAYFAGLNFLNTGQQNGASLLMAIGFAGAIAAYGLAANLTTLAPAPAPALGQRR